MAEMVSKEQAFTGQRHRVLEVVMVAIAGAAIVLAIGWAVFVASTPSVAAPSRTTTQYLQEPGLVDQRGGERGATQVTTGLTPGFQEHRRGEREGDKWATYGEEWEGRYRQMYPILD